MAEAGAGRHTVATPSGAGASTSTYPLIIRYLYNDGNHNPFLTSNLPTTTSWGSADADAPDSI